MAPEQQEWIYLFCKGDEAAYEYFFEEYYSLLGAFAMKYVKEKEIAEDIVHDVILELYSRKLQFTNIGALKSYLYLSIKNKSLNYIRSVHAKENYLQDWVEQKKENFFLNNMIEEEVFYRLRKAIRELPDKVREIYELSLLGSSYEEIAQQLSLSVDSVKAYKKRGKLILRKKLKGLMYLWILLF